MRKVALIIFDFAGTLVKMRPAKLLLPKSMLNNIARSFTLGILTGAKRTETLNILKKTKTLSLFDRDYIFTKDDTNLRKPDPKLFKQFFKVSNEQIILYIGDSSNDAKMAREAGINFINVSDFINII